MLSPLVGRRHPTFPRSGDGGNGVPIALRGELLCQVSSGDLGTATLLLTDHRLRQGFVDCFALVCVEPREQKFYPIEVEKFT
jgi:hypothetical protein